MLEHKREIHVIDVFKHGYHRFEHAGVWREYALSTQYSTKILRELQCNIMTTAELRVQKVYLYAK